VDQADSATARVELVKAETAVRHLVVHPVFRAMLRDSSGHLDAMDGNPDAARAHRGEAVNLELQEFAQATRRWSGATMGSARDFTLGVL
jgi:hypothetical protein